MLTTEGQPQLIERARKSGRQGLAGEAVQGRPAPRRREEADVMNAQPLTQTVAQIDALVESAARALFETHGLPLGALRDELRPARRTTTTSRRASASPAPEIRGALLMTTRKDLVELAWPRRAPAPAALRARRLRLGGRAREPAPRPREERARAVRPRARAEHADRRHRLAHPPGARDDQRRAPLPLRRRARIASSSTSTPPWPRTSSLARLRDESLLSAAEGDVQLF